MRKFALASALLIALSSITASGQFYSSSGRDILDPGGQPFLIKGNALSHWLNPEGYALKLNAVHSRHIGSPSSVKTRIREIVGDANATTFWNLYHQNFVTQADIAAMAAEGFNTIRIPFNYRLVSPEETPGVYSAEGFAVLDQIILWCKNNGLGVILDMHSCPGGQSHDAPADPEHTYWYWDSQINNWLEAGVACLWVDDAGYFARTGRTPQFNKQRTADIWREIALRYKDETAIVGYELINETVLPAGVTVADMRSLLMQITASIRQVDTNHLLFVGGDGYNSSFDGLVPPWDSKMVLAFHKYWAPAIQSEIQAFVDIANQYSIPICMTESGENSSPWFSELSNLLEANNIGWCWWGYKKVDNITSALSAEMTADYQYVIDNFRDTPIDATRAMNGLMQMAGNLASSQCAFDPGWYDSLLSASFGSQSVPFVQHTLPCTICMVNYDVGNQGIAYGDTTYKNEGSSADYNAGYKYRNDGVDIQTTSEGCGYKVGWISDGEWLRFTVNISAGAKYDIIFRTASPYSSGRIQLYLDNNPLTGVVSVPNSGGWDSWRSTTLRRITLPAGVHTLDVHFPVGGFDFSSIRFVKK